MSGWLLSLFGDIDSVGMLVGKWNILVVVCVLS